MRDVIGVEVVYEALLRAWNERDAESYGTLFTEDASLVGFDGTCVETATAIEDHLSSIFADHDTARYVWIIREVRRLGPSTALLRAVVGMVPPGGSALAPPANAVQSMTVVLDGGERWRIAHFQNTPAAFHGRPEDVDQLTDELDAVLQTPPPRTRRHNVARPPVTPPQGSDER